MRTLGFLSFGHYQPVRDSRTLAARDALTQTIELAIAAEEIGIGMATVRVHHFARQASTPFPLLVAITTGTHRIEIGTAVIDMRYENPYAMTEQAAVADLISRGRLQLGLSRGSQDVALRGYEAFGQVPAKGMSDSDMAVHHTAEFRRVVAGQPVASTDPTAGPVTGPSVEPYSPVLTERIWWGSSSTRASAAWTAERGVNLMSSALLSEDIGRPLDELQCEQIDTCRKAWRSAGHAYTPRVSVSRSVLPITSDERPTLPVRAGCGDVGEYRAAPQSRRLAQPDPRRPPDRPPSAPGQSSSAGSRVEAGVPPRRTSALSRARCCAGPLRIPRSPHA
ncbi:LLM class flavin-dependent oxidoreductase [Streptomyces rubrogriseus]|uniref:LLM class flavin-dependent oxidoreductase n=1 Tax=Streptomyces rubrogriseus TaxID=194673 RepID=UPI0038115C45